MPVKINLLHPQKHQVFPLLRRIDLTTPACLHGWVSLGSRREEHVMLEYHYAWSSKIMRSNSDT